MASLAQTQTHWERLPLIETGRVALRRISPADTDAFYSIYSNPEVMRYWSTPPLADRANAARQIREIEDKWQSRSILKWGIARRSDDQLIGSVTLFNLDFTHRRAEIGYALGREFWGLGYMNEALTALLGYAFETLELHRLEADVDPRNAASIKTLERLGFQKEGYLRERWQVAGEIQDSLFYGLLRREWTGPVDS
jgi:RimJ/RimL family protein N-acetyltransferase